MTEKAKAIKSREIELIKSIKKEKLFYQMRSRWLTAAGVYIVMLLLSLIFMGPFIFGFISSFKDNPTEWPPKLTPPQLTIENWKSSYRLAKEGSGKGFFGEFLPGKTVSFNTIYKYPAGAEITPPQVTITKRLKYAGAAMLSSKEIFAADNFAPKPVEEVKRYIKDNFTYVEYKIAVENTSDKVFPRLPIDLLVSGDAVFVKSDRAPNRIERLGMVQGYDNLVSGVIPYVFHQYDRVFNEQYSRATGKKLFTSWITNSFLYAFFKAAFTVLFSAMAGYSLARLKFPGSKTIFVFMLFSMMIPYQVTFISNYLVLRDGIFGFTKLFGVNSLLNSYPGLILSGLVASSSVFIMKQFFEGLPVSLEESAKMDGATTYQILFKIMLPLAKPALGAVSILSFQGAWNEYFMPMVLLSNPVDSYTLTIGLNYFQKTYQSGGFDWGPLLAGAVISAIPIIILFLVFQRYFVEGVSFSGIKE